MPNWVTNYLTVKKEVAEKYILNDKNEVDFEVFIPMPEELRDTVAPSDGDNWYDWSIRSWGCKWNASDSSVEDKGNGYLRLTFDTPWTSPNVWLARLADKGIEFHLAWLEEQGYRGIMISDENTDDRFNFITEFDLPDIEWTENEDGYWIPSEDNEPFDWRDLTYDGEYEELMNANN